MSTRIFIAGAASLLIAACAMSPTQPVAQSSPAAAPSPSAGPAPAMAPPPVTSQQPAAAAAPPAPPQSFASTAASVATKPAVERVPRKTPAKPEVVEKKASIEKPKPPAATAELTGRVALTGSRGQQVSAADYAQTIVYFVPAVGAATPHPGHYSVFTHDRDFNPEAMAVPLGSTLTFVNQDDVRHNVFSVTPGSAFDLGYQAQGTSASHRFNQPGLMLVSCKVHRSMEFDLLVVPTAFVAQVGADGRFTLRGLPEGAGTLHFWNPRAEPVQIAVKLPDAAAVSQTLVVVKPPLVTQLHVGGSP